MTDTQLIKYTVNLLPKAHKALEIAAIRSGMTRTDTINRALVMFEMTSRPVPAGQVAEITDTDDPSMVLYKVSTERPSGFWARVWAALARRRLP